MKADRQIWIGAKALEAQWAHAKGDSRTTYAITRALAGRGLPTAAALRGPGGELTRTRGERDLLMRGHFATVFKGQIASTEALSADIPPPRFQYCKHTSQLDISPTAARSAFVLLKNNKGVGNDGIPGELIRAAVDSLAVKFSELHVKIVEQERWPFSWAGGRLVDIFKRKGST